VVSYCRTVAGIVVRVKRTQFQDDTVTSSSNDQDLGNKEREREEEETSLEGGIDKHPRIRALVDYSIISLQLTWRRVVVQVGCTVCRNGWMDGEGCCSTCLPA
jgi:hypothetical protein